MALPSVRTRGATHSCAGCGQSFTPTRKGQACCSARCRRLKSRHQRQARLEALVDEVRGALDRFLAEAVKPD